MLPCVWLQVAGSVGPVGGVVAGCLLLVREICKAASRVGENKEAASTLSDRATSLESLLQLLQGRLQER